MSDHDKAADYRRRAEAIEDLAPTSARAARAALLRELADELDGDAAGGEESAPAECAPKPTDLVVCERYWHSGPDGGGHVENCPGCRYKRALAPDLADEHADDVDAREAAAEWDAAGGEA